MSLRPIDMQVVLPHATDVGRVQAVQNDQSTTSQELFAEKLMKEAQGRESQVQETQRSEFGKVTRDKEKEKERQQQKKKKGAYQLSLSNTPSEENQEKIVKDKKGSLSPMVGKNIDVSS